MVRVGSACIDRYEASIWDKRVRRRADNRRDPLPAPTARTAREDLRPLRARCLAAGRGSPGFNPRWRSPTRASACRRTPSGRSRPPVPPTGHHCNVNFPLGQEAREPPPAASPPMASTTWSENHWEWVADWLPRSTGCSPFDTPGNWPDGYGGDDQCLGGAATDGSPGALVRGGSFAHRYGALRLRECGAVRDPGRQRPAFMDAVGFRGAR